MTDVRERVRGVRQSIAAAAERSGRSPDEITLVGASKRQSLDRLQAAWDAFRAIHSVDRLKIARLLDRHAADAGRQLLGLLEVNLGEEPSKHGFTVAGLVEQSPALSELEHLRIVGMMAIPPFALDPEGARPYFKALRELKMT